jgi:Flp pilus assembly protein TadD
VRVLGGLRARYPRNLLLWLESASTALRAKHAQSADSLLADATRRFATDPRPRAFGERALWEYTSGIVRLERGDLSGARAHLTEALTGDARTWVRARTHLALGKVAERNGDRTAAESAYTTAARLADLGRDAATGAEARSRRASLRP